MSLLNEAKPLQEPKKKNPQKKSQKDVIGFYLKERPQMCNSVLHLKCSCCWAVWHKLSDG